MTGVDTDAWNGDVDEDFSDSWTDAHVRQRLDASLAEVLDEWNALRATADDLFGSAPDALRTGMVVDASVHEHDFRGAIGRPGAKDQPGNRVALEMFADGFDQRSASMLYAHCMSTPVTGNAPSATGSWRCAFRLKSSSSYAP